MKNLIFFFALMFYASVGCAQWATTFGTNTWTGSDPEIRSASPDIEFIIEGDNGGGLQWLSPTGNSEATDAYLWWQDTEDRLLFGRDIIWDDRAFGFDFGQGSFPITSFDIRGGTNSNALTDFINVNLFSNNGGRIRSFNKDGSEERGFINFQSNGTTSITSITGDVGMSSSTGDINLSTNGLRRLHISQSGLVGIGTTSPTERLHVNGNAFIDGTFEVTAGLTNPSSRTLKNQFVSLDASTILAKLAALDIQQWTYIDRPEEKHVGPVAEDFYEAFGLGQGDKNISTIDADGIMMLALQALQQENAELRERLDRLELAIKE